MHLYAIWEEKEFMFEPLIIQLFHPRAEQVQPTVSSDRRPKTWLDGFTIIEVMIVIAIICTLAAIAIPGYISSRNKAKIAMTISEMRLIEKAVFTYLSEKSELPDSLSDIHMDQLRDPWGRPYQYLRIDGGTTPGLNGKRRRDKNANPVNSDFDLYSMGRDGRTNAQFTGKKARDDIVRANNGRFLDLAEKH